MRRVVCTAVINIYDLKGRFCLTAGGNNSFVKLFNDFYLIENRDYDIEFCVGHWARSWGGQWAVSVF